MAVQKYRSVEEMEVSWVAPGTEQHHRAVEAVFTLVALFAPRRALPPGVFKYRTVEEANSERERWERSKPQL